MNRCSHPDHPHCTVWVMPGESACAHGHVQPAPAAAPAAPAALAATGAPADAPAAVPAGRRPHLHISGFDPRAAGGRQVLKIELRGMALDGAAEATLLASSRLQLENGERHAFTRSVGGEWLPVFLEFSSRGLEHGQYRIELELHCRPRDAAPRTWIATLLVLAPRADASLHEIHQTFLATHKNVRVHADDASIARVRDKSSGGGRVDIDVRATNAGIAHLDLDAVPAGGKIDLGFSSIAWDEDLLEIDVPVAAAHPCPTVSGCLLRDDAAGSGQPRYLRLFALDECVLGRGEPGATADIRLMHHNAGGAVPDGLTRRISSRHALIRRRRDGYDLEDVSRYGVLVDGAWPGKHAPLALRPGMRIELTASIPGVVVLEVDAWFPHAIVLKRVDAGNEHEAFYLVEPEHEPEAAASAQAPGLPLLFHRDGGFWQRDPVSGEAQPLTPSAGAIGTRFAARAYPEEHDAPAPRPPREPERGALA